VGFAGAGKRLAGMLGLPSLPAPNEALHGALDAQGKGSTLLRPPARRV